MENLSKYEAWKKWRTCDRKRDYYHKEAAKRAAKKRGFGYYECPYCHCFHITSK